ncbi:histidine phosphatase family protein [soil metagenome]
MTRLYLIRHGKPQTVWGQSSDEDPGLDQTGHKQAEAASRALLALPQAVRPRLVISSPLRRCRETAVPFAAAIGAEIEIDPAVGEIPTPAALTAQERPAWLRRAFSGTWAEIDGDLDYEVWRRAVALSLLGRGGTAVFSHYVAINAAVSSITGADAVLSIRPDHTSIITLDIVDGRLVLVDQGRQAETQVL